MKTHVICILDTSGSMGHFQNDVIGSFNRFVEDQRSSTTADNKVKMTVNLFNEKSNHIYWKTDINEVKDLTTETYIPAGGTALYDAIGTTLTKLSSKKRAIVLIHTDGEENSSKSYDLELVQSLIKQKTEEGWKFIFYGANIDAATVGKSLNIHDTFQVKPTTKGFIKAYSGMSGLTKEYRGIKND